MRGAIAAGHPLTAEAGARVLREGGNAVDAAVAAAFVSWVAEGTLTGPGAGGFMLVHRSRDRSTRVLDFFTAFPGRGASGVEPRAMEAIDVDFSGGSTQQFRIGGASVAVPGAALGLEHAQRSYGTLPSRELFAPAIELARGGVELTPAQAYLHGILDLILRHTPESRAIYERNGERLSVGDRLVQKDLASTLELLRDRGARELYSGELAAAIVSHVHHAGGIFTSRDLEEYRVIRRQPARADFHSHTFLSNPPPSAGGVLIAYGLRILRETGTPGSADAIDALARVMREQQRARVDGFDRALRRGGLLKLLEERAAVTRGTTHISVVDGEGNMVSLTASTGAGSGVVVPGTGIHLNNMIGEFTMTSTPQPGARLSSGMSPSIVLDQHDRPRLVVGSAGSLRLRGAVMQVVVNVVQHGLDVHDAIDRPRIHLDEDQRLHCEGGHDPAELAKVEELGWDVARWRKRNLFFGGAAAVTMADDGTLAAAGDARRGGHGVVVE
ncbi:MAG TPA: gamma-glutamyltransferase [Gaiellaceae bacterium]|jgi:gamma-glutamyltranspeptidase/glutathione hydrolase|nr:gamma-glutamyltransferase [Gaiellaceae bacterium]